ncbi:MAG TPA: hypothetical protein VNO26_08505 [Candidatus Limnocylindria bacterium]|nr:hypothetical protein [Candidatus Limnocylindria bacterium]
MGDVAKRVALGLAIVVGMTAFAAGSADAAAVLCQRKSRVRVRDGACKPKETPVQLAGDSVDTSTLPQVPSAAQADSSDVATDADALGGLPPTAYQGRIRWALVSADGLTIIKQSGGITPVAEAITGIVVLDFGEDLRGRGVIATVRGGLTAKGWAQASICGGSTVGSDPELAFCNVGGDVQDAPNEVAVATLDENGTAVERAFYVAVFP